MKATYLILLLLIPLSSAAQVATALSDTVIVVNGSYKGNGCLQDDENGVARWAPAPEGETYKRSRLSAGSFYIPMIIDWQANPLKTNTFFIQAGFEWGLAICSSRVFYKEDKEAETIRYKNFSMLTANALLRIGYRDMGIYSRYSMVPLFESNKGPKAHPFSAGVFFTL